jgi:pSer/pThr/pTyr-binding forkhead associated (FHA) protein
MAKIIITRDGQVLQEVQLRQERMTLGRNRHNDIVIDNGAVSSNHAVIVTILDDCFLEDLGSTNGTFVNGHRVSKHFLQPNDVITIAKFTIQYVAAPRGAAGASVPDSVTGTKAPPDVPIALTPAPMPTPAVAPPLATIEVLNGANAGKRLALTKPLTTLGHPGVQVVVIKRRPDGYFIAQIEGDRQSLLNKLPVGSVPRAIFHGDVIDLLGTEMAFTVA